MTQLNIEKIAEILRQAGYEVKPIKEEAEIKKEEKMEVKKEIAEEKIIAEEIGDEVVFRAPESEFVAELPIGIHKAFIYDKPRIIEARTGTKQIVFPFEFDEPYEGLRGSFFISLPAGLRQLRRTLDNLKVKFTRKGDLVSFMPEEAVGARCKVVVRERVYEGKKSHRIVATLPLEEEEELID